jgi:hypothetical protein
MNARGRPEIHYTRIYRALRRRQADGCIDRIFAGSTLSLDSVYDCRTNRKSIFNLNMRPNIPENRRGRKTPKRGRKRHFDAAIFEERFRTIECVFAWEDKFRRLLLRFERISQVYYTLKTLAYAMINLRHYCRSY